MTFTTPHILAWTSPISLEYLTWLQAAGLFALVALPIVLLGMRSLNGLGPMRKWVAIGIRLVVLLLFVLIIGGARWQRQNKDLEVIVLRDVSESTAQVRNYPGKTLQESIDQWLRDLSDPKNGKPKQDRLGVISFHDQALIDAMPNMRPALDARPIREAGAGTNIGSAIQLALATFSRDAMHRLLLITDGNNTMGDLDSAIAAAQAAGVEVQIDVAPLRYNVQNEVVVERLNAPAMKRENEPFTIDVVLRSTNPGPVAGKLTILHSGQPMDMDPYTEGLQATRAIAVKPGPNTQRVRVPALVGGSTIHDFKAVFEADGLAGASTQPGAAPGLPGGTGLVANQRAADAAAAARGDTLLANNTATAFTFVKGKGRVLYVDNVEGGRGEILDTALKAEGINTERVGVDQFPSTLIELQNYDGVILANVPRGAEGLSDDQQKMLATYIHDLGGGLVMIGGPDAFGAGGWQGSKLEEVLPVNMDIPAKRELPKGALVLVMHSCEMPEGNYWGEQCALQASKTLSERDEIGVISYDWGGGGSNWDFPLQVKGDGSRVEAAIKRMQLGDMPSFDDTLDLALNGKNGVGGLMRSDARQKHVIVISDGDPAAPNPGLIAAYKKNKVSISTITVYPHTGDPDGLPPTMKRMADETGGRFYGPVNNNPNQLPQIFIKEATVVRRSLIHEPAEGIPLKQNPTGSEIMKGLEGVQLPPLKGMVLTSRKTNPQIEIPVTANAQNDPILAYWQTGLGKAVAFTGDANNLWAAAWVGSDMFQKFWSQVVRGVSRPPMSTDFEVVTTQDGGVGRITVEALNRESGFLNFLNVRATVIGPDLKPRDLRLDQTGPGTYGGTFDARQAGNYVTIINYAGPKGDRGTIPSGMAVNTSPELRDLHSNETVVADVANRTRGNMYEAFDLDPAQLFRREGLKQRASPLPIWDLLLPALLGMIIVDVATRRIAWDWASTKKMATATADRIRGFTTTRKVESAATLGALRRIREEVAEQKFRPQEQEGQAMSPATAAEQRPDPHAKFEARGVEGDISKLVGGAADKPIPSAPKKIEPKGEPTGPGAHTGSLLEAKRRAQQQIKQKEQNE